jgi:uncharacterized protein YjbJ (UPF0337 family)
MQWKQIEGQWDNVKGHVQKKWDKLSDTDIDQIGGDKEKLMSKIREKYALSAQEAEKQVDNFKEMVAGAPASR